MEVEVEKLHINKLANVPSCLNNLKTKVDDLDVDKLKTVLIDLKKLSDLVSKKVVKKTVYNKLNTTVNNLENKDLDAINLIHINQCNTDKEHLENELEMMIKKSLTLLVS